MSVPDWLVSRPIAHRGLHDTSAGRFENTLAAADAAIAGGYPIECDVQISSDSEAMVFHDHDLDRLTAERGPVRDRTARQLSALRIGGTTDRITTLPAFLDHIAGRVPLVVEVKSRFDGDERLVRRVAALLAGRVEPVVVKSFDPDVIALVRQIAPTLVRGIVGQSRYDEGEVARLPEERRRVMTDLLHWPNTQPNFLSWRHADLPCAATSLPRTLVGTPVMTWTVRNPADAVRALRHADQIVFESFTPA